MAMKHFETIIGLEVHAQLKTASKMFCACSTRYGDPPNTNICPVCTAQPGALPVVNRSAIDMGIRIGHALGSRIAHRSIFARKNYFYPDLPKGYQISQYEFPLCLGGALTIQTDAGEREISIIRAHLEEDAGKLLHDLGHPEMSHVDFNRCGVPLIEIVSGPDMRTPKEAGDYLRTLRNVLIYLDVCEGNLQEGNFRCDANISLRPVGQEAFGTRTEMKNLNSFKAVERALAYEAKRQQEVLEHGENVIQETRLWNDALGKTESMRSKEEAHDYRYFPDPDLLPLIVDDAWIERARELLPELAGPKAARFEQEYGIPRRESLVLTDDKYLADYFEQTVTAGAPAKKAANWILSELLRELKNDEREITSCPVQPEHLAELINLIERGTISGKMAKTIFETMYKQGSNTVNLKALIDKSGFKQISDVSEIESIIDKIIAENDKQVAQYRSGKTAVLGYLVGQVMKASKGQANPQIVNQLLRKKLDGS